MSICSAPMHEAASKQLSMLSPLQLAVSGAQLMLGNFCSNCA